MRLLFLTLFSFALFAGEAATDKPLPAAATLIMKEYNEAVQKARAAYDIACKNAGEKATAALDAKSKDLGKKGDIDGAVAVKGVMEKLKSGAAKEEAEKTAMAALSGDAKAKPEFFIGSWDIVGVSPLKINEDGTAVWGSVPGTWTKGEKTIKFSWGNEIDIPTTKNCKVVDHGRNDIVYQMVKTSK